MIKDQKSTARPMLSLLPAVGDSENYKHKYNEHKHKNKYNTLKIQIHIEETTQSKAYSLLATDGSRWWKL